MKVLFCSYAQYGHLYPLLPLAGSMRDAGHEVVFATGTQFESLLRGLGFGFVPAVGSIMDAMGRHMARILGPADLSVFGRRLAEIQRDPEMVPDPALMAKWAEIEDTQLRQTRLDLRPVVAAVQPDLVIHENYILGAAFAAAENGVAAASLSVLLLGQVERTRELVADNCARLWAEVGDGGPLPTSAELRLNTCPPGFGEAALPGDIALRPVAWGPPDTALPVWLAEPRTQPLVYVTMGTVEVGRPDEMRAIIDGLAALPVDVLLAGPCSADLPPTVRAEPFLRQDLVLAHADLVVHHGGSGTTTGTLANGLRQVVLPAMADQFQNARAIAAAGVGIQLAEVTPEAVEAAARRLLADNGPEPEHFRRVIAEMPSPGAVTAELEARYSTSRR